MGTKTSRKNWEGGRNVPFLPLSSDLLILNCITIYYYYCFKRKNPLWTMMLQWFYFHLGKPLSLPSFNSHSSFNSSYHWSVLWQWYPILDQNSLISILYPRLYCFKTIPFTAAHTLYILMYLIYERPPPPGTPSCFSLFFSFFFGGGGGGGEVLDVIFCEREWLVNSFSHWKSLKPRVEVHRDKNTSKMHFISIHRKNTN